jgi:hypothetical protein
MVSRGEETLPQQASQATREATQLARGVMEDIAKTKSQLSVKEQELKDTRKKLNRAEFDVELGAKLVTLRGNEITQLQKDLEQEKKSRMPQRPPPKMTTTGTEMPQRPPPNMTTSGTNTALFKTTTTGTEMAQMTTTGVETLPQRTPPNRQDLSRTSRELSGTLVQTKRELSKYKAELAKSQEALALAEMPPPPLLKRESSSLDRPPPERPLMVSRGEETLAPLPSMDRVFSELTRTRQAREFAMELGKTKAQLRETDKKLKETLKELDTELFNVEVGEKATKIYTDERDKAVAQLKFNEKYYSDVEEGNRIQRDKARDELQRTKNQLTEAEAGRRNAQNKGYLELELEKQAREAEQKESSQILTRTKEELERMKMSSQDVKALPAKPANLAQLKSLASMKAETDKFMEISRQARFSMDREYRASQASLDSRDSLDFSNIQQINERQLFELRQRRTMEPVSQRNLLNVDVLSSLPKSRLSALVEQNIARQDERMPPKSRLATRLEERQASLDDLPPSAMAPLKGIPKPTRPSVRPPRASKSRDLK